LRERESNRDFVALSSVEKITAAQSVQPRLKDRAITSRPTFAKKSGGVRVLPGRGFVTCGIDYDGASSALAVAFGAQIFFLTQRQVNDAALAGGHGPKR